MSGGIAACVATVLLAGALVIVERHRGRTPMEPLIAAVTSDARLVAMSPRGGKIVRVLDRNVAVVRWSPRLSATPDGKTIFYSRARPPTAGECPEPASNLDEVAAVPLIGGPVTNVAAGTFPAVSPDGHYLAYVRNAADPCNTDHDALVLHDLRTGSVSTLVSDRTATDLSSLSWAPDSRHLAYIVDVGINVATVVLDTSTATSLNSAVAMPHDPSAAWVGFLTAGENLAVMPADAPQRVVTLDAVTGAPGRALFPLPEQMHNPDPGALRADGSGDSVLVIGTTGLYLWTKASGAAVRLAAGVDAAAWIPAGQPRPAPSVVLDCPGTQHVSAHTDPDGLPAAANHAGDRSNVERVLQGSQPMIRHDYRGVVSVQVGAGGGYEWAYDPSGSVVVRSVKNYAIYVRMAAARNCPSDSRLHASYSGVGLTFVFGLDASTSQ